MPLEDGDINVESAVDTFLAEDGNDSDDGDAATDQQPPTDTDGAAAADDADDADSDTGGGADPAGDADGAEPAKPSAEREPTELEKAIKAKDVKAFIAALGDAAEELMGGKAHKVLRLAAKELRVGEEKLAKSAKALTERFADPTAAFEAAKKGPEGADAFVEAIERQFGGSIVDCIKYIQDAQAGKDVRLQAKAKADAEKTTAADAKRTEHEKTLRTLITDTVKTSDAKLLEADPEIVDDVFRVMKSGWSKGINTPAKALALVKKRYQAIAKLLAPAAPAADPAPPRRRAPAALPPPREPQAKGASAQDVEDMVAQFLREEGYHGR